MAKATWASADSGEGSALCPGQPTWADDLAVLFQTSCPTQVVPCVRTIAQAAEKGLLQLGLTPNFLPNKSEALPVFLGRGSKAARREALASSCPAVDFTRLDGTLDSIRLVSEYTHLGTVLRSDLSEIPNIRSRERLMQGIFRPVRAKLLANDFLTPLEKSHLLRERVFSRYLFGSGLWRLSTLHEVKAAEEPLAKVLRSSMRPVAGLSSRGLTIQQCAAALHLPTPKEMLDVERARTACELAANSPNFVWLALIRDQVWANAVQSAIAEIMHATGNAWHPPSQSSQLYHAICAASSDICRACRAYLRKQVESRPPFDHVHESTRHITVDSSDEEIVLADLWRPYTCFCGAAFPNKRQLAVHTSRMHKQFAPLTQACWGTGCERCNVEYWSWERLRGHLRKSPLCYAVYEASDIVGARPPKKGHCADPEGAWRPPLRTEGPRPWWATLTLGEGP